MTSKKKMWPWLAGGGAVVLILGGLALAFGGEEESDEPTGDEPTGDEPAGDEPAGDDFPNPVFPVYNTPNQLEDALRLAGYSSDWITFFLGIAANESGFVSNVVLGNPALLPVGARASSRNDTLGMAEAAAASTAFQRALEQNQLQCEFPASRYTYGSAGWWAMLPANALAAYDKTSLACRDPWALLHPADQIVCAMEFARRLQGWKAYQAAPSFLTLRQGWANPSKMNDPAALAAMRDKFKKHLSSIGVGEAFMDKKPSPLPAKNVVGLHTQLLAALK